MSSSRVASSLLLFLLHQSLYLYELYIYPSQLYGDSDSRYILELNINSKKRSALDNKAEGRLNLFTTTSVPRNHHDREEPIHTFDLLLSCLSTFTL